MEGIARRSSAPRPRSIATAPTRRATTTTRGAPNDDAGDARYAIARSVVLNARSLTETKATTSEPRTRPRTSGTSGRGDASGRERGRGLACDRSVGDRVRANGGAKVKHVHPLPLSVTHDDAFAERLGKLRARASDAEDVYDALRRRKEEGSRPGARTDELKIGLVVEGGGMRGVISAGAAGALLEAGYYDCFDAAYGSSAGAMNLTYYLSKQPEGIFAYEEDLCDGSFLDLKRHVSRRMTVIKEAHIDLVRPFVRFGRRSRNALAARNGASTIETATMADVGTLAETLSDDDGDSKFAVDPAMNVNYLLETVMGGETGRPLRWKDVITSSVPLKVVATSLDTLTTVILDDFKDEADLKKSLLASARVPALAGSSPVTHRGHRLVDAAVLEPVPVHAAAHDGCTHILVLLTAPHKVDTEADVTNTEKRENRRFLGQIRERLSRVRRSKARDVVAAAASDTNDSDLNKSIDDLEAKPKPAQSALYRAIRNLLFAPSYMGAVWDLHDSYAATLDARHGWRARDVFIPSTAPSAFHPIKIATIAPSGPASKAMSSLCVDADLIAAARREGAAACFRALGVAFDDTASQPNVPSAERSR